MAGKNDRLDLSSEFRKIDEGFLADVQAAADEVKKRRDSDKAGALGQEERARSRRISSIIIAVAAVLILLISYWVVFGGPGGDDYSSEGSSSATMKGPRPDPGPSAPNATFVTPRAPQAPPRFDAPVGGTPRQVEQPPDGYDQPGDNVPGM